MNYVNPLLTELSITSNDIEYTENYYTPTTYLTGVTDEAYSDWLVGTAYNVGDYVIVPELKRIFRSATSHTGTFPPSDSTVWQDWGVVNSYAMFASDSNIGSLTTGTDSIMEFDFSQSDTIVGVDLNFVSATIILFDTSTITYLGDYAGGTTYAIDEAVLYDGILYSSLTAGNTGNQPDISPTEWDERDDLVYFDESILGSDIGCLDYADYYYTDKTDKKRVILTDLEWLPESILRITMSGASSIGTINYGKVDEMGVTLRGTSLSYESTSAFSTNEFTGYREIIRYGKVRILEVVITYDLDDFNVLSTKIDDIIDKNIIFIPSSLDKFSEQITIGYIEKFKLPVSQFQDTQTVARVIGVNK